MKKKKFKIEYPLSNASAAILWNSIGTVHGLSEWFADDVSSEEDNYIFKWDDYEQKANLLHFKPNNYIRFQWEEDKGTEAYFEMKIVTSELSNDVVLYVTDYAEKSEVEDAILLWNKQIENLKRITGM
ncbi:MAG: START-like domain-containing protein [Paludibacter sp.]|nr:START-like domain-containing protein [Paludibacter sp.]MDD4199415.1 START-like domain-containing protein [Paludibacter sp.]MDD4429110.1 START-like domain-containing protein [Paludibacter sp.]